MPCKKMKHKTIIFNIQRTKHYKKFPNNNPNKKTIQKFSIRMKKTFTGISFS